MIGWLFAFLVHSTLWYCLARLWTRLRPDLHARVRETVWLTAISASLITPTVQMFVSPEFALWRLPLPAGLLAPAEAGHVDGGATIGPAAGWGWPQLAVTAWLAIAGVLVLRYFGRLVALRRRLRERETVEESHAMRALRELSDRAGLQATPRLTESDHLGSPIAIGIGPRSEICIPTRALYELDRDQLRALLGHEVAHHLRLDTLRLGIIQTLRAVFFFQPLLRLATRELHCAVEEQCDDWAARQIEDRLAMASCLTEVATWALHHDRHLPVPCIVRRNSPLKVRVDRLLSEQCNTPAGAWSGVAAVGILVIASLLAPAVSPAGERQHEDRTVERENDRGAEREHPEGEEHRRREEGEHGDRRERGEHDEHSGSMKSRHD